MLPINSIVSVFGVSVLLNDWGIKVKFDIQVVARSLASSDEHSTLKSQDKQRFKEKVEM